MDDVDLSRLRMTYTQPKTKKAHLSVSLFREIYGAGTRSRTRDLLITSQLLYQLSYTGVWALIIGI